MKQFVIPVVVGVFLYCVVSSINWLNWTRHMYNHAPGPCRILPDIEHGSEDIQALSNGLAFISSGLRLYPTDIYNNRDGKIYLFDFNQPHANPIALRIVDNAGNDYRLTSPHGISIWTNPKSGEVYLYVISHHPVEAVDKFLFDSSSQILIHQRRFANDTNFHVLNDLAVVGDDQFYFTNYHYCCPLTEIMLGLRWGSVGFFDGTKATLVLTGMFIPNGIAASLDRRSIYVSQLGYEELIVCDRRSDNSLERRKVVKVWTKMDNLDVNLKTGDIWTGAHPVGYRILQYMEDPLNKISPSQVLRIRLASDQQQQQQQQDADEIVEVFSDDGTHFSGSSIAVAHGNGMLVGSVASHTVYCELL